MLKTIEWPPGSGVRATYDEAELEMMAGLRKQLDADEISSDEFKHQVTVIHAVKADFPSGRFLSDAEAADLRRRQPAPWDEAEVQLATRAHARTTDPATSKAAAASITADALRATQQHVLDAFSQFGAMHHELLLIRYDEGGFPPQSVSGLRTRTSELVKGGLLKDSGRRVQLSSRRASIVWELAASTQGSLL